MQAPETYATLTAPGAPEATPDRSSAGIVRAPLIYLEFFLTGVVTVLLGAILPALRARFGVSEAQAGGLFIAQFAASAVGALFSQVRIRFSIVLGLGLIALGVSALPFSSWPWAHVAIAVFGVGLGFAIPATNMYVAAAGGPNRAAALNVINFVWGIGSVTTPLLIAFLQRGIGLKGTLLLIATTVAGVFAMLVVFPLAKPSADQRRAALDGQCSQTAGMLPLTAFCLMLFLYVGVETTIGGWTSVYVRAFGVSGTLAPSLALFCFWFALLGGRVLAPLNLRWLPESPLYRISLSVAAIGIVALIASRSMAAATASAFVVGAGLAPLFALTVAMLSRRAEASGTRVPGWVFSIASMGGAALPWLAGVAATYFGSIRYGLFIALIACLPLFFLHVAEERKL